MASFKLREPRGDKETTIFFTMAFKEENKTLQYPTGVKIHPQDWDPVTKRPKRKLTHTSKINASNIRKRLNFIEDFAEQKEHKFKLLNEELSLDTLRDNLNAQLNKGVDISNDFFSIYDQFLEAKRHGNAGQPIQISTYNRYVYNKRLLKDFKEFRGKKIRLKNIDEDFYNEFLSYCISEKKHTANTLSRNAGLFKTFLRWTHEKGKTYNTAYLNFKNPAKQPTMEVALTKDQLSDFHNSDLSNHPSLDRVKDIFVFGCLTGQRFSNYSNIKKSDIVDNTIMVPDCKDPTKILKIPLLKPARDILVKYDYRLPVISNQKFNKYIKIAFEKLGYTENTKRIRRIGSELNEEIIPLYKRISSHTARRTFITVMLNEKVPAKIIMSITGHRSLTQFLNYYKISDGFARESMDKVLGDI